MSVGKPSPQSELETSVQASLRRADKEIKTALKKLVDSASLLVTLPPDMPGGDHGAVGPLLLHEASTQTQAAGGQGRSGMKHGAVGWGWVGHSFGAELPGNRSLKAV